MIDLTGDALMIAAIAAFVWGLRHGVDWDHIAAITDIASVQEDRGRSIRLGGFYIVGHALVIGTLAILAILVGAQVPGWLDASMGSLVGITLIALGVYVVLSVIRARRRKGDVRLQSKWGLMVNGASRFYERLRAVITRTEVRPHRRFFESYTSASCVGVGMIHGIGAETPTQVILFSAAAGIAGTTGSLLLLGAFLVGMLVTNGAMVLTASRGLVGMDRSNRKFLGVAAAIGLFSIGIGVLTLSGLGDSLPPILADPAIAATAAGR